jgi:ParB family transcriptional regulator, chromosome partitioning protein
VSDAAPPRAFRRRGLGRGLEALLTNEAEAEEGSPLINVDPRTVAPNPEQPRRAFEPDALAALGDSIRLHGLLHPIVVQREGDSYSLVAGERRLRAAQLAGVSNIPAIVRPAAESGRQQLEIALTENLLRTDLNPMEEAAAYARLSDAFGLTHEAIALRLGRSRSGISNTIRLLDLPAPVQEAVADALLTASHARALLVLPLAADQEAVAALAIAGGLNVRDTERAVQERLTRASALVRARTPATASATAAPDDVALRRGLEHALGVPVRLQRRKGGGGRIVIDWAEDSDLDEIYRKLGGPPL